MANSTVVGAWTKCFSASEMLKALGICSSAFVHGELSRTVSDRRSKVSLVGKG